MTEDRKRIKYVSEEMTRYIIIEEATSKSPLSYLEKIKEWQRILLGVDDEPNNRSVHPNTGKKKSHKNNT